ncbi:MAG: undecaprenyl-diphosphate phosphatase [Planctomycetota bacterium]
MNTLDAIALGLVEGITEYLPVSSTGHLILTASLLGLDNDPQQKAAVDTFNIVVQGGAILAVLGLYFSRVMQMCRGLVGKDKAGLKLAINIVVAFLPAAVLGVLFNEHIERVFFNPTSVLTALFLGGIWMIWLDAWRKKRPDEKVNRTIDDLTIPQALGIGLFQCVAMIPGTSRSMMTIAGGTLLGLKPKEAAEFSFLLGLPTLGGACVYKLVSNVKEANETEGMEPFYEVLGVTPVLVGIAVATVSAAFAVKWLVGFLTKHGLAVFGYYRIGLAIVMGALIYAGVVSL